MNVPSWLRTVTSSYLGILVLCPLGRRLGGGENFGWAKSLNFIQTAFICSVWLLKQTTIISLHSIHRLIYLREPYCVPCQVRIESLHINFTILAPIFANHVRELTEISYFKVRCSEEHLTLATQKIPVPNNGSPTSPETSVMDALKSAGTEKAAPTQTTKSTRLFVHSTFRLYYLTCSAVYLSYKTNERVWFEDFERSISFTPHRPHWSDCRKGLISHDQMSLRLNPRKSLNQILQCHPHVKAVGQDRKSVIVGKIPDLFSVSI